MSARLAYLGDRNTFARLLSTMLAGSGYELVVYASPGGLAAAVQAAPDSFSAVIIDGSRLERIPREVEALVATIPTVIVNAADTGIDPDHGPSQALPSRWANPSPCPSSSPPCSAWASDPARRVQPPQAQPLALVVDDEAPFRIFVEHILTQQGWRVLTACDGVEALEVVERTPDITAFIVDLEMPRIDGPTLVARSSGALSVAFDPHHDWHARPGAASVAAGQRHGVRVLEKPFTSRTFLRCFGADAR